MTRSGSVLRLGTALMALAVASGCSSSSAARLDSYRTGADDRLITVSVTIGEHDSIVEVNTTEDAEKVVVDLRVEGAAGTGTDLGVVRDVDVSLKEPLAGRVVVDGTGQTVPKKQ